MIHPSKKRVLITAVIVAAVIGTVYYVFQPQDKHAAAAKTQQASNLLPYPETITGKIITLHKLDMKHAPDFYRMFSATVRKPYEAPKETSLSYIKHYIAARLARVNKNLSTMYVIFDNVDNQLVGAVSISEKEAFPVDFRGQLSMWINEHYRGGGRMQEAVKLLSQKYFDVRKDRDSYVVHVRVWNYPSIAALEKYGFTKIGDYPDDGNGARYIYELKRGDIPAIS